MFSDLLNLPIDRDRLAQQDQILCLSGMAWSDYEQLTNEKTGYRIAYSDGIITIVSPSLNHEKIAEIINGLVKTYCRKYDLLYFPMGSTTLKNPFTVGKEPDHSFCFEVEKDIPDLAIEVIFTRGGIADLQKYKYLNVSEVWIWRDREISFYRLVDSEYVETDYSYCLRELASDFLIEFINRGLTESPLTIEADFINRLNCR